MAPLPVSYVADELASAPDGDVGILPPLVDSEGEPIVQATEGLPESWLPSLERAVVEEIVTGIVTHDVEILRLLSPDDPEALYQWVRLYEPGGATLVVPPGRSTDWAGGVFRATDDPTWRFVQVQMWIEGPAGPEVSDLTLQLDVWSDDAGTVRVDFRDLHVL
jgi:hypothetical protein